jgi:hypothetical protein
VTQELCNNAHAKAAILDDLTAVGKAGKLKGFELIKALHLGACKVPVSTNLYLVPATYQAVCS